MQQVERREDVNPLVQSVTRSVFTAAGSIQFLPDHCWDITFIRNRHGTFVLRTGLTTRPVQFDVEPGDENFAIAFKPFTFMPLMPGDVMRDEGVMLDMAGPNRFMLGTESFEIPRLDSVEDFVRRLAANGALETNPLVASVVSGHPDAATERTLQRHFLKTTGLTLKTYGQIARARRALVLLGQSMPAAEVAYALGYADQPHLIRSLRAFMGTTPGQVARASQNVLSAPG